MLLVVTMIIMATMVALWIMLVLVRLQSKVSGDPGADRRLTPGGRGGAPGGARLTTGPALPLEPESKFFVNCFRLKSLKRNKSIDPDVKMRMKLKQPYGLYEPIKA